MRLDVALMDSTALSLYQCWCCSYCAEQRRRRRASKRAKRLFGDLVADSLEDINNHSTSSSTSTPPIPILCPECGGASMCYKCVQRRETQHREETGNLTGNLTGSLAEDALQYLSPVENSSSSSKETLKNGIIPVDTDEDETQNLFVDAFLHNNRLEHIIQVMGYHPKYLESFLKTQQFMMRGDGPLPYEYRHYIAIMAAGRHLNSYLINIQQNEFLLQGGDERWLKGLDNVPQKLRDLYEINKLMAHRPWLINKSHIEKLTKGSSNWSLSELMHAIVLLAHFHALSSFVYGCGITSEIDHEEGHTFRPPSLTDSNSSLDDGQSNPNSLSGTPASHSSEEGGGIEALMERMSRLNREAQEEMTQEELLKRFEGVEVLLELPAASKQPSPKAGILKYVDDPSFTYQDFAKRGQQSEIPTFRAQDYSWSDQGFSLANRLYADIGSLLDDKFQVAYNLTYFTMGDNEDVDTTSFRLAIWNYIHCMFGIRHDDYDYSEVNQLLERNLKAYVKTVTCYPERITKRDYDSFMREFKHSEKVHVNLMVFEARLQAELLYALRAVMRYMT